MTDQIKIILQIDGLPEAENKFGYINDLIIVWLNTPSHLYESALENLYGDLSHYPELNNLQKIDDFLNSADEALVILIPSLILMKYHLNEYKLLINHYITNCEKITEYDIMLTMEFNRKALIHELKEMVYQLNSMSV